MKSAVGMGGNEAACAVTFADAAASEAATDAAGVVSRRHARLQSLGCNIHALMPSLS